MKRSTILLVSLLAATSVAAQTTKANYKQAQKLETEVRNFNNDLTITPQFINNSDHFWFSHRTSDGVTFYIINPEKKQKETLFDVEAILTQIGKPTAETYDTKRFQPSNLVFDKKMENVKFYYESDNYSYHRKSKTVTKLPKDAKREYKPSGHTFSPDSCYIIYAFKHNLYVYGNKEKGQDTTLVQLTTDGNEYASYAKYATESENQSTSPKGRWLKNSKSFLVTMDDDSKLDFMHLVDVTTQPRPKLISYKYPLPGDSTVSQYTMRLVDIKTKKMVSIPADKWKDQSLSYVFDNKAGDKIFFYRSKRTADERELCIYDANNHSVKGVLTHKEKPYIDYQIDQTHVINDGKEVILRSEQTGYGHFYLYDVETGKLKREITKGSYVTGQMVKMDTVKREIYFYGFGREKEIDPYYYVFYRVQMDHGKIDLITPENANHKVTISPSKKFFIDNYSRVDMDPVTVLRDRTGKVLMELGRADLKAIYETGWRKPERFSVKAADGVTDLYGVLWKPMDFDSTKTYPIISDVYPGPQYEYVPTSFTLKDSHATLLSQLGFIVIQVGHRGGTPIRGKFYQRYGYGKLRDYPLADDKAAITQLSNRYRYINRDKVGIYGHSGGGFMSVAALCTYPDFYTAAVASAGNHDNRIYNNGWIETNNGVKEVIGADSTVRFQSLPIQTNMELAKNYKGHLLLVHGLMDNNVNPAHTLRMAKALIDAGKSFEMVLLPKSTHGFVGDENTFFEHKMWRHFAKFLLNDPSGDYNSEINKYEK